MFPFKSLLLELLWSSTASFEPQDQKQKPKLGFLRAWLWPSNAHMKLLPSSRDERWIKAESAVPKCVILASTAECVTTLPSKTRCSCSLRARHWGRAHKFTAQDSSAAWVTQTQFCLVVPFPDLNTPDLSMAHTHQVLPHTSFYFKYPSTPSDAFWGYLKTEARQN